MTQIKLRFDCDYAFASRLKSLRNMARFNPNKKGYMAEACKIATIINQSKCDVIAYWFFTKHTLPNDELLNLLKTPKHEIGLHIANNPWRELELLQKHTKQKITYYTIHGTDSKLMQIIWGRRLGQKQAIIPKDFPLKPLNEPTFSFDKMCFGAGFPQAVKVGTTEVKQNHILSMHPEWLINDNGKDRGQYYFALNHILMYGV